MFSNMHILYVVAQTSCFLLVYWSPLYSSRLIKAVLSIVEFLFFLLLTAHMVNQKKLQFITMINRDSIIRTGFIRNISGRKWTKRDMSCSLSSLTVCSSSLHWLEQTNASYFHAQQRDWDECVTSSQTSMAAVIRWGLHTKGKLL